VFCLGFQEVVELIPLNVAANPPACTKRALDLQNIVLQSLNKLVGIVKQETCTDPYEAGVVKSSELFVLVAMEREVGLASMVFARTSLVMGIKEQSGATGSQINDVAARCPGLSEVQSSTLKLGNGGLGNKAGIAVSFMLHGSSVCFITSHIAAHRKKVKHRIRDVEKIMKQISFESLGKDAKKGSAALTLRRSSAFQHAPVSCKKQIQSVFTEQHARLETLSENTVTLAKRSSILITSKKKMSVLDHDMVFFCGDLNFRLRALPGSGAGDGSVDDADDDADDDDEDDDKASKEDEIKYACDCIDADEIDELLQYDQLVCEQREGNLFQEFDEMEIDFPPTYKYVPGSDNVYDRGQFSGKSRLPAWCDRVMFSSSTRRRTKHAAERQDCAGMRKDHAQLSCDAIVPELYHAEVSGNFVSDHRPVLAMFDVFPIASTLELKILEKEKAKAQHLEAQLGKRKSKRSNAKLMAMLG
jgi:hypothetical protein